MAIRDVKANTFTILADLQNTNLSLRQIAEKRGVSHQRVSEILATAREAGILFPNRPKAAN